MQSQEISQLLKLAYHSSDEVYHVQWKELFCNDLFINQITTKLQMYGNNENTDSLSLPNPSFETTPKLSSLIQPLYEAIDLYKKSGDLQIIRTELGKLGPKVLYLIGLRSTAGTELSAAAVPPRIDTLLKSINEKYNDRLTVAARSWSKHAFRCEENYWPQVKGSPDSINEEAVKIVEKLLENKTWWNVFGHFKHNIVYEIRDKTGHGARWSIDGKQFIGFVEPLDPESGMNFQD